MPASVLADPSAWVPPLTPSSLPPPETSSEDHKVILELGCGVGNSAFPLMRANLNLFVHACDCSPTAIASLVANPEYDARRCHAFVADLSEGDAPLRGVIGDASVDAVTGVFFFSALDAATFRRVVGECRRALKPGGVVLFRDYSVDDVKNGGRARGTRGKGGKGGTRGGGEGEGEGGDGDAGGLDLTPGENIGGDAWVRPDGTLAVFTDETAVTEAFHSAGFTGECWTVTHEVVNRKLGVTIVRSFLQGRFVK
tara:strand:+ start:99 stop:860 length:762 start_codon:yes stop_codon:yes gene_type:complete